MTCRFGRFELDQSTRELRLDGTEIPLQPRVFDLLALLYRNRERVMSKEELMDELWPGVIVGEGSLQRAVSLARSTLKQGDMADAIRNFTRKGYRFCVDEAVAPAESTSEVEALEAARAAYARQEWDTAVSTYRKADRQSALGGADLEQFAEACHSAGHAADVEPLLERAVAACSAKGDAAGAARSALYLAEAAFESARLAVARGWLNRARHFLRDCEAGWEHGYEAYLSARIAVATGDAESAVQHGTRALALAEQIGSDAIEALARMYLGYGEIASGNFDRGIGFVDEAAAAALSDEIAPRIRGIIYCGLIWLCCNRGDWQRASQWGDSFERWCDREGKARFTGLCQLHRAEVLSVSGEAEDAEREIRIACDQLAAYSPFAAGDAFRILGDLHRVRGELELAEAAYRRAHSRGWDPQPGLALLLAEQGEPDAAISGLLRAIDDSNWALRQRRGLLLATLAKIAARHGHREHAVSGIEELDSHRELWESEHHNAAVAEARAELAVLEGDTRQAAVSMREAVASWQAANANLNQAACRFRLAQLLADDGDVRGALLELEAAQSCFTAMHAPERAKACARFADSLRAR